MCVHEVKKKKKEEDGIYMEEFGVIPLRFMGCFESSSKNFLLLKSFFFVWLFSLGSFI